MIAGLVSRPIFKMGRFAGVAVVSLSPEYLSSKLSDMESEPGDVVTLFYSDGAYLARNRNVLEVLGKSIPPDRPFLLADAPGHGIYRVTSNTDQVPRIFAWHRLEGYPFVLIIGLDERAVLAPVEREIGISRQHSTISISFLLVLVAAISLLLIRIANQQNNLSKSEVMLRSTLESTVDGILVVDSNGIIVAKNWQYYDLWHIPHETAVSEQNTPLLAQGLDQLSDPDEFLQCIAKLEKTHDKHWDTLNFKDGRVFEIYTRAFQHGEQHVRLWSFRDITTRKQAEEELRIAAVAFASQNGMVITDPTGVILRVNPAFTRLTGYSPEEAIGHTPALLHSGRHDQLFYQRMWDSLKKKGYWQDAIWNKRKNGQIYAEMLTITAVITPDQRTITH